MGLIRFTPAWTGPSPLQDIQISPLHYEIVSSAKENILLPLRFRPLAMATANGELLHVYSREYAVARDAEDAFRHLRGEFHIPTKAQLNAKSLPEAGNESGSLNNRNQAEKS